MNWTSFEIHTIVNAIHNKDNENLIDQRYVSIFCGKIMWKNNNLRENVYQYSTFQYQIVVKKIIPLCKNFAGNFSIACKRNFVCDETMIIDIYWVVSSVKKKNIWYMYSQWIFMTKCFLLHTNHMYMLLYLN